MPYLVCRETNEGSVFGRVHASIIAATSDRKHAETIAYIESNAERECWQRREALKMRRHPAAFVGDPIFDHADRTLAARDPKFLSPAARHFVHASQTQAGMLAYTKTAQHGHEDRQTIIKPGKYLTSFYSEVLTPAQIVKLAALCTASASELTITQDADTIALVYSTAEITSCMDGRYFKADDPEHPCRVYAGPDLALAYVGDPKAARARAIVWPEKQRWYRTYGHCDLIERLLEAQGYSQGSLSGARIRAIHVSGDTYVMPYVDGLSRCELSDDQTYFTLGRGDVHCNDTGGTADVNTADQCEHCEEYNVYDGGSLCESCAETTSRCESCDDRYDDDRMRFVDGTPYCDDCYSEHYVCCDHCGEDTARDYARYSEFDGADLCSYCYSRKATDCSVCDQEFNPLDFGRRETRDREARNVECLCEDCAKTHEYCSECDYFVSADDHCECITTAIAESAARNSVALPPYVIWPSLAVAP